MYVVKKQLGLGQPLEAPGLLLWERGKRFRASIELTSAFQGLARCIGKQRERSAAGVEESLCFVGGQPVNRWQQVGHEAIHESGFLDYACWRAVSVLVGVGSDMGRFPPLDWSFCQALGLPVECSVKLGSSFFITWDR